MRRKIRRMVIITTSKAKQNTEKKETNEGEKKNGKKPTHC
jgi:hypothetical protein